MSKDVSQNWDDILNKKARGIDADLGKVEAIAAEHIITNKGILSVDRFFLPKKLVDRIEFDRIWLNLTENEAEAYKSSY